MILTIPQNRAMNRDPLLAVLRAADFVRGYPHGPFGLPGHAEFEGLSGLLQPQGRRTAGKLGSEFPIGSKKEFLFEGFALGIFLG